MTRHRGAAAWGEGCFRRAAASLCRGRSEQGRPEELLLPTAGAIVGLGGEMSRRCSCYRIVRLGYQLLVVELSVVAEFLLSSRVDDTRSWSNFLVYFSHKLTQMPYQPEGLGIHIYRLVASQTYAKMLV